ncbi:MAG: hypothetical protein U0795_10155 [Pirellulales bacterium]
MGFLKNFFKNVFHEQTATRSIATSSFDHLSEEALEAHLGVRRYGDFTLTDAIRPSYDLKVVPRQGFRHDVYHDRESHAKMPVLMAAASKERLFELFVELLEPLGNTVDVVLETSHTKGQGGGHVDLYREHMDMPVLLSSLWDFEDLLTNDGCTGIAVLNPHMPQEIQFDEHKLLIVYGHDLTAYEQIFEAHGVHCNDQLQFITEAEHVHSSTDTFVDQFEQLRNRLGMDAGYSG